MAELMDMDAVDLVVLIPDGKVSPLEVMEAALRRIDAVNPVINAFVSLRREEAIQEAKEMTESLASGAGPGPLAGIPVGVKDLEDVKGMVTSFGSIPYKNNVARQDSVQVARLRAAGAIVVGKTNTPEFGFTGFTKSGLPVGLQIVGPRHREDLVLQAAHAFEKIKPWNDHWPDLGL